MKKIRIETKYKKMLSDVYTPVGIYLRLRDRFRDTILLESAESASPENSFSFIGINAIAGMEIRNFELIEFKYPNHNPEKKEIGVNTSVPELLWNFMQQFEVNEVDDANVKIAQGLFGYSTYDAVQFFETIKLKSSKKPEKHYENLSTSKVSSAGEDLEGAEIPLMRYRLYQYIIAINHFKDEMYLCENIIHDLNSELELIESLITSKNVPAYPFKIKSAESANMPDDDYIKMVEKGIGSCLPRRCFSNCFKQKIQPKIYG